MSKSTEKSNLLGKAPIPKALLAMGIPTMLGMMINAVYTLVDAYFVGSLGTSQMGAIFVVYPLGQVIVGLGLLFGNGAGSYISRLLGNQNRQTASKVASTAVYSSLLAGGIMIVGSLIFLNPLLQILGATDSMLPFAHTYSQIYLATSIFNIFNVTMNSIVTSEGAAKTTMLALLSGALLNMALVPIFIHILQWGVAGAAAATAISQCVSTLVYIRYIFSKKSAFSFSLKEYTFSKEIMAEILKIGIPTLTFQLLTSLSITLINMQLHPYGDSVIAGMGVVTRVISMGSLIVFGFIKGFQPIAGYSYGAKRYDRLYEAIKVSVIWSTLFCVLFGFILVLFPAAIVSQFTTGDAELLQVGVKALRANGLSFMLFGFYTVYSSLFLALGKAKAGFFLGICRQGLCFIPVILLFPKFWGINGVLYAQPLADLVSTLITVGMSIYLYKELAAEKRSTTLQEEVSL